MIKSILKDSLLYGVVSAFNKLFMFFIFFIFVNYFIKADIAVLDMLLVFSTIMTIFVSMQLESSFARFYFNEKKGDKHFDLMKTVSFMMVGFGFFYTVPGFFVFYFIFNEYMLTADVFIFTMIVFIAVLYNINNVINLHFRYLNDKRRFLISSFLFPLTYLSIIYIVLLINDELNFFTIFVSQALSYITSLLYQLKVVGNRLLYARFQSENVKNIFKYSIPMLPMFFLIFANDKAIIYILREFISLDVLADFSIATKYLAFLSLFFFSLRMALEPRINRFVSFPSVEGKKEYVSYINIYICLSAIVFVSFILIVPYINKLYFPQYSNSYEWSVVLGLGLVMLNLGSYMTPGFAIKQRMDIKLLHLVFQVIINFSGFYIVLRYDFNVTSALIYLAFVNFIFILIQHYYSNKLYKVSNEYAKTALVFVCLYLLVDRAL